MMIRAFQLSILLACFVSVSSMAVAQNESYRRTAQALNPGQFERRVVSGQEYLASAQNFVESSSPVGDGRQVTARSSGNSGVQTVTEIASLPLKSEGRARLAGSTSSATQNTRARYPYPANSPPRYPQPAYGRNFNLPNAGYQNSGQVRQTAYQRVGGAYPASRYAQMQANNLSTAQNNCCTTNRVTAGFQGPVGEPPVNIEVPGVDGNAAFQSPTLDPNVGIQYPTGQFGTFNPPANSAFRNWWTPMVTGSGAYQPIIRLQNLPPGTYLGQGLIGQPTAYVDGQPIRNLLRYISP